VPSGKVVGRIALALSSDSSTLYISITGTGKTGSTDINTLFKMLKIATATGVVTDLTSATPNYLGSQGGYDTTLAVAPGNPNLLVAAGQGMIVETTKGGSSWTNITTDSNGGGPHPDHHAAVFDSSGRLLDGNDGGIFRFDPATGTWADRNGDLSIIQFY